MRGMWPGRRRLRGICGLPGIERFLMAADEVCWTGLGWECNY